MSFGNKLTIDSIQQRASVLSETGRFRSRKSRNRNLFRVSSTSNFSIASNIWVVWIEVSFVSMRISPGSFLKLICSRKRTKAGSIECFGFPVKTTGPFSVYSRSKQYSASSTPWCVSLRPRITQNGALLFMPMCCSSLSTSASERKPRETATAFWQTLSGYSVPNTRKEFFCKRLASRFNAEMFREADAVRLRIRDNAMFSPCAVRGTYGGKDWLAVALSANFARFI